MYSGKITVEMVESMKGLTVKQMHEKSGKAISTIKWFIRNNNLKHLVGGRDRAKEAAIIKEQIGNNLHLSPKQLSKLLGVSLVTVYRYIDDYGFRENFNLKKKTVNEVHQDVYIERRVFKCATGCGEVIEKEVSKDAKNIRFICYNCKISDQQYDSYYAGDA